MQIARPSPEKEQVTRENSCENTKNTEGKRENYWINSFIMAAAQVARKLKDKRQKRTMEEIFKKVNLIF